MSLSIVLVGCGGPSAANPPKNPEANLDAMAHKLQTNPDASPEARVLAGNVLKKVQTDQVARDFQAGK